MQTVLCINGSDSMGNSGIQADIRTLKDFGCYGVTAVTSVTIQNSKGISDVGELSPEVVLGQIRAIYEETIPAVVKVGMVNNPDTIRGIRQEIAGCRNIVCSPAILSSFGGLLMSNESIRAFCQHLLPLCTLLIMKCIDAEIVLGHRISTDRDMAEAANRLHEMGAGWVLLRGGTYTEGRINALLSPPLEKEGRSEAFFSSVNIEGWQRHGVGGTLSTAIAARLAMGDDVSAAVTNAHHYLHNQVVYASNKKAALQPHYLYDRFMSLLSDHYARRHDVAFYAAELAISPRYLSQITGIVSGHSPKQIIDEYLVQKSEQLLTATTMNIQQIADQLGFCSQISFAKFFRTKKGSSPSSYRTGVRRD